VAGLAFCVKSATGFIKGYLLIVKALCVCGTMIARRLCQLCEISIDVKRVTLADDMSHFPEQSRVRFILEHPTPDGVLCPQLSETRPCTSLPRCVHYHWQVSAWSTCMFADHTDQCGDHGYRVRGTSLQLLQFTFYLLIAAAALTRGSLQVSICHVPPIFSK